VSLVAPLLLQAGDMAGKQDISTKNSQTEHGTTLVKDSRETIQKEIRLIKDC
jgi:hypothetical protein